MAVPTLNGSAATPGDLTNQATPSFTWNHTVASGSDRCLVVRVPGWLNAGTITNVTYGGTALTQIAASGDSAASDEAQIWYLTNPPVGTAAVEVTISGNYYGKPESRCYDGVRQTSSLTGSAGVGTGGPSRAVTTEADCLVLDCVSSDGTPLLAVGANQTQHYAQDGVQDSYASEETATGTSVTMSWTTAGTYAHAHAVAVVWPVGAAVTFNTVYLRDAASDIDPGAELEKLASPTRGAAAVSKVTNTAAGPTAGVQVTNGAGGTAIAWLSAPLDAVTIAGTVTFNVRMAESAAQANTGAQVKIERCNGAGVVQSTIVNSEQGTELTTSESARNWTATPTSTALSAGDRIKITVLGNDAGGNMGSGRTFTLWYDGPTAGASGDSYVTFTESLSEQTGGAPADVGWQTLLGIGR